MKVVVAFFFGALFCVAQKPANCWDSNEHVQQCVQAGDAEAEFTLGLAYDRGIEGIQQDYERAAKWYRLAALQGHPQAQANLGLLYAAGEGVPQDYAEAFRWSRMAAHQCLRPRNATFS